MDLVYLLPDLKVSGKDNCLIKFADDYKLLVPESSGMPIQPEILLIKSWFHVKIKLF